jgi:hypothetical protein
LKRRESVTPPASQRAYITHYCRVNWESLIYTDNEEKQSDVVSVAAISHNDTDPGEVEDGMASYYTRIKDSVVNNAPFVIELMETEKSFWFMV